MADASGRLNLLSVSTPPWIEHHLLHSSTDDSKPELRKRAHLSHGFLTECPVRYIGRFFQPCPLVTHWATLQVSPLDTPSDFRLLSDSARCLLPTGHSELHLVNRLRSWWHLAVLQVSDLLGREETMEPETIAAGLVAGDDWGRPGQVESSFEYLSRFPRPHFREPTQG